MGVECTMTTLESIFELNKIFKSKNWTNLDIDEFVFNNSCTLLDNVSENQRELIIELLDRYMWISLEDYQSKILKTMENVDDVVLSKLKVVYIFPIIKKEDEGRFKSGQFLIYQIKAFKKHLKKYRDITFKYVSKFETFETGFRLKPNEMIFLIDDYIGSGETLRFCLNEIQNNNNEIVNENIQIVTIVTQKEIADNIRAEGYGYQADTYSEKGISDFNSSPVLEEKIRIMLDIEKMIPGGSHFSLGYNGSEALITLARTPDNTFPIFWKEYKKGGKKYDAPFSREETIEK